MDKYIERHLLCWYSPQKQGVTTESLAADPRLRDLSGKGNDLMLHGSFTMRGDGGMSFKTVTNYGKTGMLKALRSFTVICDRYHAFNSSNGLAVAVKGSAFCFDVRDYGRACYVFGRATMTPNAGGSGRRVLGVMTPHVRFDYAGGVMDDLVLGDVADTASALQIGVKAYGTMAGEELRLYHFLLFDKTLTSEQIDYAVTKYIYDESNDLVAT